MIDWLVVWLPFFIFPYIGNNHPNWLSYFSEGWPNHQPVEVHGKIPWNVNALHHPVGLRSSPVAFTFHARRRRNCLPVEPLVPWIGELCVFFFPGVWAETRLLSLWPACCWHYVQSVSLAVSYFFEFMHDFNVPYVSSVCFALMLWCCDQRCMLITFKLAVWGMKSICQGRWITLGSHRAPEIASLTKLSSSNQSLSLKMSGSPAMFDGS